MGNVKSRQLLRYFCYAFDIELSKILMQQITVLFTCFMKA